MKKNLERRFTISLLANTIYVGSLFTKWKTFIRILPFDLESNHSKTNCWQKIDVGNIDCMNSFKFYFT